MDVKHYPRNNNEKIYLQSSPIIPITTTVGAAQGSNSLPPYGYKESPSSVPVIKNICSHVGSMLHITPVVDLPPHIQNAAAMLSATYKFGSDMNPLRSKKLHAVSSMLMSKDASILQKCFDQPNVANSSHSVPLVGPLSNNKGSGRQSTLHSNETHRSDMRKHSAYKGKSRIVFGTQKLKTVRTTYRQYSTAQMYTAIESIKNGTMTVPKASHTYGVPTRTLYEKINKGGVRAGSTMSQLMKPCISNGGVPSTSFPYEESGCATGGPYSINPNYSYSQNQSRCSLHNVSGYRDIGSRERDHHIPPSLPSAAAQMTYLKYGKYLDISIPNGSKNPFDTERREQREHLDEREQQDMNQHRSSPDDDEVIDLSIPKKRERN